MATSFDRFHYPFGLRVYRNHTSAGFDSSSVWQPSSGGAAVTVTGHLSSYSSRQSSETGVKNRALGQIEESQQRFFCATTPPFSKGDVLEVDQDLAGTIKFQYTIEERVRSHHFMAGQLGEPVRYEYTIAERPR